MNQPRQLSHHISRVSLGIITVFGFACTSAGIEAPESITPAANPGASISGDPTGEAISGPGEVSAFVAVDGQLVIEAESFHESDQNGQQANWQPLPRGDASGETMLVAAPDNGENFQDPGVGPVLSYTVSIDTPGDYYCSVRMFADGDDGNSVHVGVDGVWPETGDRIDINVFNQFAWAYRANNNNDTRCMLPGLTAGVHTIMVGMREDGTAFDQIVFSTVDRIPDYQEVLAPSAEQTVPSTGSGPTEE